MVFLVGGASWDGEKEGGEERSLLVSVDDGCEVDLSALDGLLQHRRNPRSEVIMSIRGFWASVYHGYSLRGVGRIDNDGILGLFVRHQVGVVVTTAHP
jgi:hypothetical protein